MNDIETLLKKLYETNSQFTQEEVEFLESLKNQYLLEEQKFQKMLLSVGLLLDYNNLKAQGKTLEEIQEISEEDKKTIFDSEEYLKKHKELKENMFGYPANMTENTSLIQYLKYLESQLYLINGCGGPKDKGNYQMDNKVVEIKIIKLFLKNLNLDEKDYWGYITSGGTEGNYWGIRTGFDSYPNGKLYFSDEAHYSVNKYVNQVNFKVYPNEKISSINGKINSIELLEKIKVNWKKEQNPAIILLTWGTTKTGAIDEVEYIEKELSKLNIPHYIHLDAALYGGIPNNQNNAPVLNNLKELNVDSVSISLHKYLGSSKVNGVLISRNKSNSNYIEYIGQEDSTVLGSRDFLPFSVYQQIIDLFCRSNDNSYQENINYFMEEAEKNNIKYYREGNGNILVIDKPSDELCIKYQLATYTQDSKEYAHIIIFPSHKKENILSLINDISLEQKQAMKLKKNNDY